MPLLKNKYWLYITLTSILLYALCVNALVRPDGFDVAGYTLTARSIVQNKTMRVDPIIGHPDVLGTCGAGDCQTVRYADRTYALDARGEALYNYYPIGTSLVILPLVALSQAVGFEIIGANAQALENQLAALATVIIFILSFVLLRQLLSPLASWLWAVGIVLASPLISTVGTALWSSDYATVLNLLALLVVIKLPRLRPRIWAGILGVICFASYLCKPNNAILIATIFLYLALYFRKYILSYLLPIFVLFIIFMIYSLTTYQQLLPPYYMPGDWGFRFSLQGLWGALASPSRGLFIYQPYLLIVLILALLSVRRLVSNSLFLFTVSSLALYILSFVAIAIWWGGFSFGSRMVTEAFPLIILACAIIWKTTLETGSRLTQNISKYGLILLFIPGIYINSGQGLFNPQVLAWNGIAGQDFSINKYTDYLWSWRYPQFLANSSSIAARNREFEALQTTRVLPDLAEYNFSSIVTPDSSMVHYAGWLHVETGADKSTWRWANGTSASIWFRLPNPPTYPVPGFILVVKGNPYSTNRVDVYFNHKYLGTIASSESWPAESYSFQVDDALLKFSDYNVIEFCARDAVDPQQDYNQRFFYLQSLEILPD